MIQQGLFCSLWEAQLKDKGVFFWCAGFVRTLEKPPFLFNWLPPWLVSTTDQGNLFYINPRFFASFLGFFAQNSEKCGRKLNSQLILWIKLLKPFVFKVFHLLITKLKKSKLNLYKSYKIDHTQFDSLESKRKSGLSHISGGWSRNPSLLLEECVSLRSEYLIRVISLSYNSHREIIFVAMGIQVN